MQCAGPQKHSGTTSPAQPGTEDARSAPESGRLSTSGNTRCTVQSEPVMNQEAGHFFEALGAFRLCQVGISAHIVGPIHVSSMGGGSEHHDGEAARWILLPANPFQHLKTRTPRQLDIQQHEGRNRVSCPIVKRGIPAQVSDGLVSMLEPPDRNPLIEAAKGALDQVRIVWVIFDQQHSWVFAVHTFGNSNQNVDPWPGLESSPTLPPMRSIARFTMARPIPVPA